MSLRARVLRGSLTLAAAGIASQILSLVRNVLLARLLGPEEFGTIAALVVSLAVIEAVSDASVDKMLVQAKDGDEPTLQGAAQAIQCVRGLGQFCCLFGLSWAFALLFDMPQAVWAFQAVAVGPLLRGLIHLDPARQQRSMRFVSLGLLDISPQLVAVAAVWPLAHWLGDYRVAVVIILLQASVAVVVSHLLAERSYRWAWDAAVLRRLGRFGWPLMLNGLLMFGMMQGDRLIVGASYTKVELGLFAAAATLVAAPTNLLLRVIGNVFLPVLAMLRADRKRLELRYRAAVEGSVLINAMCFCGLILVGPFILASLFGNEFRAASTLIPPLALAGSIRVLRGLPVLAAMSIGESRTVLIANLVRLSGVALAVGVAMSGFSIDWIAWAAVAGELCAFVAGIFRVLRMHRLPVKHTLRPVLYLLLLLASASVISLVWSEGLSRLRGALIAILAVGIMSGVLVWLLPELRKQFAALRTRSSVPVVSLEQPG